MSRLIQLVCFYALVYPSIEAARILAVFPTPSISHQVVFRPLIHELARRDHNVVVVTTDPAFPQGKAPDNLREIDVHDVSYDLWNKLIAAKRNGEEDDVVQHANELNKLGPIIFEKQCENAEVRGIIKNDSNFDLLIVEAWPRFVLGFSHVIKAPVITMTSFNGVADNHDVIGAPSHPLMYPQPTNTRIYNLTLWEKVKQLYTAFKISDNFRRNEAYENAIVKRIFGENTPALSELQNNIDMFLVNTHPLWDGNRPVPPSLIHIGGIHLKPQKDLPQDLKTYLDSSKHGVIYVSFGTNVETSSLPADKIQAMINVFSQLPFDILWKWNQDELPGRTEKIKISKWLPQSDLLRHPNVKLFVTQGGLQSTDEALAAGVPMIGIPMFFDQWYNVEKYVHHKIGIKIDLGSLDKESFMTAVKILIEDKSYRANVVRLRTIMQDQPMGALERAVWWTEHALRHGGARHLRAPAANMPAARYYELEIVLIVLTVVLTVTVILGFLLYQILQLSLMPLFSSAKIKSS